MVVINTCGGIVFATEAEVYSDSESLVLVKTNVSQCIAFIVHDVQASLTSIFFLHCVFHRLKGQVLELCCRRR